MKKIRLRKLNNQGSTFVLAIIAITLVTMLALAILSASTYNIAMKNLDRNSKVNFYTAETVVDEVCAGTGKDSLEALGNSYRGVITTLVQASPEGYEYIIDNEAANKEFKSKFIESMLSLITGNDVSFPTGMNKVTSTSANDKIIAYLKKNIEGYDDLAKILSVGGIEAYKEPTDGYSYMIIIRDVEIQYKEEKGGEVYFSVITTDIEIKFPNMRVDFTATNRLNDFIKYVFIADDNINITGVEVNSSACMYAGGLVKIESDDDYTASLAMNGSHSKNTEDEKINLICGGNFDQVAGTIELTGSSTYPANFGAETTNIWCTNFKTNADLYNAMDNSAGANINIVSSCNTYIKDDMTLDGQNSTVTLEGEYYGYSADGAANLHADSSAIIINAKKANMTINTRKLLLGGYSYVELTNTDYYMLGESLSFRGDQEVYLIPSEYLGVGYDLPIPNPMSESTFNELVTAVEALNSKVEFCNVNGFFAKNYLKDGEAKGYDVNFGTTSVADRKGIDCPYVIIKKDKLVYVYCNFNNNADAAKYIHDIVNTNKAPHLKKILNQYTANLFVDKVVKITDEAKDALYTHGTLLMTSNGTNTGSLAGNNSSTLEGWVSSTGDGVSILGNDVFTLTSLDLKNRYDIYTHLLADIAWKNDENKKYIVDDVDNALWQMKDIEQLTNNEMTREDIFGTIVDKALITTQSAGSAMNVYNENNLWLRDYDHYIKVIVNDTKYEIPDGCKGGIVVATGDVHVKEDFEGMIIAGGSIIVEKNVTISNNKNVVEYLIKNEVAFEDPSYSEDIPFRDYFFAYKHIASEDNSSEEVKVENIDYKDIVKINNWRKYGKE